MLSNRKQGFFFSLSILLSLALGLTAAGAPKPENPGKGGGGGSGGWEEPFTGSKLSKRWKVASWFAPGYRAGVHQGFFETENASLQGGYLTLKLTQEIGEVDGQNGVISHGAQVFTRQKYGYGTYEWNMRMASTSSTPQGAGTLASGGVSAGFIYVNNSETEIDFEWSGHLVGTGGDETLYMVNWHNVDPTTGPFDSDSTVWTAYMPGLNAGFHTFKFVWEPGKITYYVNGVQQAVSTTDVPEAPANFMINHWGTHNANGWGGAASVGDDRYFHIDWVRYTPLP